MPRSAHGGSRAPRALPRAAGAALAVLAGWGAGDAAFRATPLARTLAEDPVWRARPHALESVHREYLETPADAGRLRVADSSRVDFVPPPELRLARVRSASLDARIPWSGVLDLRFPAEDGAEYVLRLSRNERRPGGWLRVENGRAERLADLVSGPTLPPDRESAALRRALEGVFSGSANPAYLARAAESRLLARAGRTEARRGADGTLRATWNGAPLAEARGTAPLTGFALQGSEGAPCDAGAVAVAGETSDGAAALYATSFSPEKGPRAARLLAIGAAVGLLLPASRSGAPWAAAPLLLAWLGRGGLLAGALLYALGLARRSAGRLAARTGDRLPPLLRRAAWAAPAALAALALLGTAVPAAAAPASALGAAGLVFLALLTLALPRGAPGANRLLLLWAALLLAGVEWSLRASPLGARLAPEWTRGRAADQELFWRPDALRETPARPEALLRVVAMGGSSTWGRGVEASQAWPAALGRSLDEAAPGRFETRNLGVEGYTTFQALRFLEREVLRRRPDAVLWDFGHNDGTPSEWGLPYSEIDRRMNASETLSALRRALGRVRLYQALKFGILRARSGLWSKLDAGAGTPNVPLPEFRENLRRFAALGREKGFEPAIVLEPADDVLFGPGFLRPYAEAAREAALETGTAWVDPLPTLAGRRDDDLFLDNVHPTPRGHALIAEAIREQIGPRLLALQPRAMP